MYITFCFLPSLQTFTEVNPLCELCLTLSVLGSDAFVDNRCVRLLYVTKQGTGHKIIKYLSVSFLLYLDIRQSIKKKERMNFGITCFEVVQPIMRFNFLPLSAIFHLSFFFCVCVCYIYLLISRIIVPIC